MAASSSDKHTRIADLFHRVAELTPPERRRIYDTDEVPAEIREEIEALLGTRTQGVFTEDALGQALQQLVPEEQVGGPLRPGMTFADYDIVREVARGGMGAVFEAKQRSLGRTVALKIILGSRFATADDVRRFRNEAESVARLDHPGIVPVYEVGEHGGEHFFSMAFVGGGSLDDREVPMAPIPAAHILERVADAIHYAHAHNVVHRDLKPANVLLSDSHSPKVSDFGLAKDTREGSDDLTRTGMVLGTPGFLSPEQARGEAAAVGPAADVYGLGGILFYLLTGRAPFAGANPVDTMHSVLHDDAPPVDRLQPGVPRDLASICAKCLAKAPEQRYASAQAVQHELQRFLRGEPVVARPIGRTAKLARWCRRNPFVAAASFLAVASLLVGATVATWFGIDAHRHAKLLDQRNLELEQQALKLQQSRDDARNAVADATTFKDFLIQDLIRVGRPLGFKGGQDRHLTLASALTQASERLAARFQNRPIPELLMRHELGLTLQYLGEYERAEPHLRIANQISQATYGPRSLETLWTRFQWARALESLNRLNEARAAAMELMEILDDLREQDLPGTQLPDITHASVEEGETSLGKLRDWTRHYLSILHIGLGQHDKAIEVLRALQEDGTRDRGGTHMRLGHALRGLGRDAEAFDSYEMALAEYRNAGLQDVEWVGLLLVDMADLKLDWLEFDDALPFAEEARSVLEAVHGTDHPYTLTARLLEMQALRGLGSLAEAEALTEQILADGTAHMSGSTELSRRFLGRLGNVFFATQPDRAVPIFEQLVEHNRAALGGESPITLHDQFNLVTSCWRAERFDQAKKWAEDGWGKARRVLGPRDKRTEQFGLVWAWCLQRDREWGEAEPIFRELAAMRREPWPEAERESRQTLAYLLYQLGEVLSQQGRPDEAVLPLEEMAEVYRQHFPNELRRFTRLGRLGEVYVALGRYEEAEQTLRTARRGMEENTAAVLSSDPRAWPRSAYLLRELYRRWGKQELAEEWSEQLQADEQRAGVSGR